MIIRRVHKITESDYQLGRVSVSASKNSAASWRIEYFSKFCPEYSSSVKIEPTEQFVSLLGKRSAPMWRCTWDAKKLNIPCMKREDQQDATIRCLLLTSVSTCFGHYYARLQENKGPVTAFGVLFWFCWMWLVATKSSNRAFVLLKTGIIMPETCWDRS